MWSALTIKTAKIDARYQLISANRRAIDSSIITLIAIRFHQLLSIVHQVDKNRRKSIKLKVTK